jgi:hypothetical protein
MSTAFHPQSDGQTERFNRILEDMLRHYVSPEANDWDRYLDLAEFAMNDAWHEGLESTPFLLNYGQHPRRPECLQGESSKNLAAADMIQSMQRLWAHAKLCLEQAQQRQKAWSAEHRAPLSFQVGDKVLLSSSNLKLKGPACRKLWPKWLGPFTVTKCVGKVAYELALPPSMKVHKTFHVSLLKPYRDDGRVQPPPPPVEVEGELEFEVEKVLLHRDSHRSTASDKVSRCSREFLVKWKGYGPEHNTWEPERNLTNCKEVLQEYLSSL